MASGVTTFYLTDTNNPTGYSQPLEAWASTDGTRANATLNMTYLLGSRAYGRAKYGRFE